MIRPHTDREKPFNYEQDLSPIPFQRPTYVSLTKISRQVVWPATAGTNKNEPVNGIKPHPPKVEHYYIRKLHHKIQDFAAADLLSPYWTSSSPSPSPASLFLHKPVWGCLCSMKLFRAEIFTESYTSQLRILEPSFLPVQWALLT